jgi:hypothetical protein
MRFVPQQEIEDYLFNRSVAATTPALSFGPIADGKLVFTTSEYYAMGAAGNYSALPMIMGTNANEGASFVTYNATNPNLTVFELLTQEIFTCPAAKAAGYRVQSGLAPTFRYQYAGNFSNISPLWWMGAYHSCKYLPSFYTWKLLNKPQLSFPSFAVPTETSAAKARFLRKD